MKKFLLLSLLLLLPSIDVVAQASISNDGHYVWALVDKTNDNSGSTLVIRSTLTSWKKEILGASKATFAADSKTISYIKNDTLSILTLGTDEQTSKTSVGSFKEPIEGSGEWLAYQSKDQPDQVTLLNRSTQKEIHFKNVTNYYFDSSGGTCVLETQEHENGIPTGKLQWVELTSGKVITIWSGSSSTPINPVFSADGTALAFVVQQGRSNAPVNTIWYYKKGLDNARVIVNERSAGVDASLSVADRQVTFGKDGTTLFFYLKEQIQRSPNPHMPKLDVWSYTDAKIYSFQLKDLAPRIYMAAVAINDGHVTRLEQNNERVLNATGLRSDDFVLVCQYAGDIFAYSPIVERGEVGYSLGEYNWNKGTLSKVHLVSAKNGTRNLLQDNIVAT